MGRNDLVVRYGEYAALAGVVDRLEREIIRLRAMVEEMIVENEEEGYSQDHRRLELKGEKVCNVCFGTKVSEGEPDQECSWCRGTGSVPLDTTGPFA